MLGFVTAKLQEEPSVADVSDACFDALASHSVTQAQRHTGLGE